MNYLKSNTFLTSVNMGGITITGSCGSFGSNNTIGGGYNNLIGQGVSGIAYFEQKNQICSICDVPIKTGQEILAKNGFYECKKCYDLFLKTMGDK